MPSSGLWEGLTVFAESNFGQETLMVEPFSEIGMIAQVSAIQPVMDQPSPPSCESIDVARSSSGTVGPDIT